MDMWSEGSVAMKYSMSPYNDCIGKISLIQEPGFKLRAVANPNRVLQSALQPLKVALGKTLARIDQDCTFDQYSGVETVRNWLRGGKQVYSVDLSDATNLFPLDFTQSVLVQWADGQQEGQREIYRSLVDIFTESSRMPFYSKIDGVTRVHKFTRGQPLGLGPSFFAFSLSHHQLVRTICEHTKVDYDCYRILGDDIVINHPEVYKQYRISLTKLGCSVSEQKSMTSSDVAEFAGKIITKGAIIPQFKWREISDLNVVDFVRNIGPSSVSLLKPRQRSLINFLSEVPTFLGGLGWNPAGKPLEERLEQPINQFLLNKVKEVLVPSERVDRPIVRFASDPRHRDLTPHYIKVDGLKGLIPTRDLNPTQWGSKEFWTLFYKAQASHKPFESFLSSEFLDNLYSPLIKEIGDPRHSSPWFEVLEYYLYFAYNKLRDPSVISDYRSVLISINNEEISKYEKESRERDIREGRIMVLPKIRFNRD